ncbi:MAG: hypothetical protein ACM3UY_10780 [Methanocella sp.]
MKEPQIYAEISNLIDTNLTEQHKVKIQETVSFVRQVLGFLPRAVPDYTDHGIQHSLNLMTIFNNYSLNISKLGYTFTEQENYLLTLAIWIHDIGLLITKEEEKSKHNENSIKVMESHEFTMLEDILGKDVFRCLKYVVKFHSSHTDLNLVPKHEIIPNVRLRLICAVFRLLDGCDITSARTTRVLYNLLAANGLLKADSIPFWKAHLSISSAVFQGNDLIVDCDNLEDAKLLTSHLEKDLVPINKILSEEKFPEFKFSVVQSEL